MKTTTALKPLAFALAAIMAMAAQANPPKHDPKPTPANTDGASAAVIDTQYSHHNAVLNQGTKNNASMNHSVNDNKGNVGVNNASGDGNQQDNSAAIATADEHFIFGSAAAATNVTQNNSNNTVANYSTKNNASLDNSANNNSGNLGLNNAAGNFNQQKNNLAIAVSGGRVAAAGNATNQTETGLIVNNLADRKYEAMDDKGLGKNHPQMPKPDGWKNVVRNNASLDYSVNGNSGNIGVNNAAGVGNQQSNSLSIAAGCSACAGK